MTQPAQDGRVGVPVCPRHPDRESYVRCQRCERPACPECQRPAAVGVHCVDCVREAQRTTPRTRTVFGAPQHSGRPVVTYSIIAICVVLNLGQHAVPGLTQALALVPAWTAAEPWRLITSAFLHATSWPLHVLLNMYALYLIGPYLEDLFGRVYFTALYLLAALGGSAGYILIAGSFTQEGGDVYLNSAVGASGAVFGLFGALVVVQRRLGRNLGQVAAVVGINLVLGFVIARIAWQAHLGGLVVGAACAALLAYAPRSRRRAVQLGGLAAVTVAVVVLTVLGIVLTEQFPVR